MPPRTPRRHRRAAAAGVCRRPRHCNAWPRAAGGFLDPEARDIGRGPARCGPYRPPFEPQAESFCAGLGQLILGNSERCDLGLAALAQEDLYLLLGSFQCRLTMTCELDAALEGFQRLIERQIAALEPAHETFKLCQSCFKVGGLALRVQRLSPL